METSRTRRTPPPRGGLRRLALGLALLGLVAATPAAAEGLLSRPELRAFIDEMIARHGFDGVRLATLFGQVETRPDIIAAITRPAEAKPWHEYRKIFLTESRIAGGVRYWDEHAERLAAAGERFGVPPEVVVAIIGVETRFGGYTGKHRVIDALTTLAFDYPKRGDFFRGELEAFLLLSREEGLDPLEPLGSYAGAMGYGQFIPSSYRAYAIDFDGDGHRDLFANHADAIGSVANYFARHGWRAGGPVVAPATVSGDGYRELVALGYKPQRHLARFADYGVAVDGALDGEQLAALLELELADSSEHWAALHNFYVITRYNHSPLYAMAVHQLSQAIRARRAAGARADARG
ncbi:MAG TPA: lytic murein transglycosylase B [Gammaproteobacteria bacterium]